MLKPNCYTDETINSMRIMDAVERELDAIIVKLLGKSLNFYTMRDRLQLIWKLFGGMNIVDIAHGF